MNLPKTISVKVIRATVITGQGYDKINLTIDAESPFPALDYAAYCNIEAQKGFGKFWCEKVLGITPEIIQS